MTPHMDDPRQKPADEDREPFARRYGMPIIAGLAAVSVIGAVAVVFVSGDGAPPPKPVQELTIVNIIPPPPPPPPPPEVQPPPEPEQEMIEQVQVEDPEIQAEQETEEPQEAPPEEVAADEPPTGPLGLDQAAEGPGDQFNLAARPGARGFGGGGGGGSRWGWYASIVQQQIEGALHANPKTRNVVMQVQVRLWADKSGRVSRVQLVNSTGDPEIDAVIRSEVLAGLTLRQPPPDDMPMPMVARITARRST